MTLVGAERSSALHRAILVLVMPTSKRHFAPGQLPFLTSSTYRRAKLLESDLFRLLAAELRRRATSEAALANYDATVATYCQTTLTAFQQVEDNLAALRILEQEAQQQQHAVDSAQESRRLFTNRYKGGVDAYLQVITAQTFVRTNARNNVDILRRRMDASVLLIKALGGGWNVSSLPSA